MSHCSLLTSYDWCVYTFSDWTLFTGEKLSFLPLILKRSPLAYWNETWGVHSKRFLFRSFRAVCFHVRTIYRHISWTEAGVCLAIHISCLPSEKKFISLPLLLPFRGQEKTPHGRSLFLVQCLRGEGAQGKKHLLPAAMLHYFVPQRFSLIVHFSLLQPKLQEPTCVSKPWSIPLRIFIHIDALKEYDLLCQMVLSKAVIPF